MASAGSKGVRLNKRQGLLNPSIMVLSIDGSDLGSGVANTSSTPLDYGSDVATAYDDGSNKTTVVFNETLKKAPKVFITLRTSGDIKVDAITVTTTGFTYTTVKSSDGSTTVADADTDILVVCFDTDDIF